MKKRILSIGLVLGMLCIISISAVASQNKESAVVEWGNDLQSYISEDRERIVTDIAESDETISTENIQLTERNQITLTQKEIDMAHDFYVIAGYDETEASELALEYVKEINALYEEALLNGYSVTDEDIRVHLDKMKEEYKTAVNKEEIEDFIGTFESEEAYWEFQYEMFKKDLPIQQYISDKESQFFNENASSSRILSIEENEMQQEVLEQQWIDEFNDTKNDAKSKYDFVIE